MAQKKLFKFSEQFSITDLDKNAVSNLTAGFLWDREHGSGNNIIKLEAQRMASDKYYIHYRTYPTYSTENVRISTRGTEIPTKYYDTLFEFEGVENNVGSQQLFNSFNPAEKASVTRDFIEQALCRVWCNCGAFYYQSHWEMMASHNSTIFPFPGPKGDGIWAKRHSPGLKQPGIQICKHIAAAIHHMLKRDVNTIVSFLEKNLPLGETNEEDNNTTDATISNE